MNASLDSRLFPFATSLDPAAQEAAGWKNDQPDQLDTKSSQMRRIHRQVELVARTSSTVLLSGETGTGKGYLARRIHQLSGRKDRPFISVHCGAIPDTLIESELFGHERGAFTGAVKRKQGRFALAHQGTIFLDEIGTVTPALQIKLLQFMQDHTFSPVGGEKEQEADVRVIAATNGDLAQMVQEGLFRKDLFYRLNVFPLQVPPLRERPEDIAPLARVFIQRFNQAMGKNIKGLNPDLEQSLCSYDWPGNIRELENLLERAFILEEGDTLGPDSFPTEVVGQARTLPVLDSDQLPTLSSFRALAVEQAEKHYLVRLLTEHKGRIAPSAAAAGLSTRQLHKLMTKYGLHKEDYKSKPG